MLFSEDELILCESCDYISHRNESHAGKRIRCPQCKSEFPKTHHNTIDKTIAFSLSALFLYYHAFFTPIIVIKSMGFSSSASIFESILGLYHQQEFLLASIVLFVSLIIPLALPLILFSISILNKLHLAPQVQRRFMKSLQHFKEWGMTEVYFIGILVSIIKIYSSATIEYNPGFFIFLIFNILVLLTLYYLDEAMMWKQIDGQQPEKKTLQQFNIATDHDRGIENGIMLCETCHKIVSSDTSICPRCTSAVHFRKPESLNRATSLVVVSIILFIPANVLPIMRVEFLGKISYSTIMDGIIYFLHAGDYFIGSVIFIASVLVPLYKMIGIMLLLISVRFSRTNDIIRKTKLFKGIEFIGKWSMLDIFVIAIMAIFINFGDLSATYASTAAIYFAAVVIFTMLAGRSYDIRLLWDKYDKNNRSQL